MYKRQGSLYTYWLAVFSDENLINENLPYEVRFALQTEPQISFEGPDQICGGETAQLNPSTGGTWASSNDNIATINNSGFVTPVSLGSVTFVFTNSSTLCTAESSTLLITAQPIVSVDKNVLCVGESTLASPSEGGTWTSSNSAVCTVNNSGLVTSVSPGTCMLVYNKSASQCPPASISMDVLPLDHPDCIVAVSYTHLTLPTTPYV